MLIIGERINSSRKSIEEAISKKDTNFLIEQARLQIESGADFIDVNCAVRLENEKQDLIWLIETLQENLNIPISIDSPSPEVISAALKIHKGKAFINSTTAESKKLSSITDVLEGKDAFIIGLTMDDNGMPTSVKERVDIAKRLIDSLKGISVNPANLYVDSLVKPISSEPQEAKRFLEAVAALKQEGINTIGGLSNVSYGLPARRILNTVFLSLASEAGIDAAIIDPVIKQQSLQKDIIDLAKAALLGEDAYCANYIKAFREGKLNA